MSWKFCLSACTIARCAAGDKKPAVRAEAYFFIDGRVRPLTGSIFRNPLGIVGRDEFEAADDEAAFAVAEFLFEALSDCCTSFELWRGTRLIQILPPLPLSETIRERVQAIVIEREEAIQCSRWAVAQSKQLLERLADVGAEPLRRYAPTARDR